MALLFPLLTAPSLLVLLLWMERVERSLPSDRLISDVLVLLETAQPEEIELVVSEGLASALAPSARRRRRWRRSARSRQAPDQSSGHLLV